MRQYGRWVGFVAFAGTLGIGGCGGGDGDNGSDDNGGTLPPVEPPAVSTAGYRKIVFHMVKLNRAGDLAVIWQADAHRMMCCSTPGLAPRSGARKAKAWISS